VRIEKGESGGLSERTAQSALAAAGRPQSLRPERPAQRPQAVPQQEQRARQRKRRRQRGRAAQDPRNPGDTGRNQRQISGGTKGHDGRHVLAQQSLAQHEGILRADGDDETGAQGKTRGEGRDEHAAAVSFPRAH